MDYQLGIVHCQCFTGGFCQASACFRLVFWLCFRCDAACQIPIHFKNDDFCEARRHCSLFFFPMVKFHGAGIYTHIWVIFWVNIGKYFSTMEHLGIVVQHAWNGLCLFRGAECGMWTSSWRNCRGTSVSSSEVSNLIPVDCDDQTTMIT